MASDGEYAVTSKVEMYVLTVHKVQLGLLNELLYHCFITCCKLLIGSQLKINIGTRRMKRLEHPFVLSMNA